MQSRYTLVTVAHAGDAALLSLQARSLARFVPAGSVFEAIRVVDNTPEGEPGLPAAALRRDYGPWGSRVEFVPARVLGALPGHHAGWWTQQVRKLQVASLVGTERYLLLDAKNHFIRPIPDNYLQDILGRVRTRQYSYETHPLRPKLENTFRFMGLDPARFIGQCIMTSTPFTMVTAHVREILAAHGAGFAEAFLRNQLTEFFFYYAYQIQSGKPIDSLYTFNQTPTPLVWPHQATGEALAGVLREADDNGSPLFGVHRGAVQALRADRQAADALSAFWLRRSLFGSADEARSFLDSVRT